MKEIDYDTIVFVIGNSKGCFVFKVDKTIIEIEQSIMEVSKILKEQYFIQVNNTTLINGKYYANKEQELHIKMQDGYLHKVFRRRWGDF